jgi:PAS domain S-box-containing protein
MISIFYRSSRINPEQNFRGAMKDNEEKFEIITQSTLEIIFIIDKTGHFIFFNDRLESVLGYRAEEAVGNPFSKFMPLKEIPRYLVQLRKIFMHKDVFNFTTRVYHKNGHLLDVEISGKLTKYKGEVVGQGTIRDISERKRVEDALYESLNSYKGLFDSVSEAIYIHKADGVFIDVNVGATLMYGYSRDELIGKNPELVSAPGMNNLEVVAELIQKTMITGKPGQIEFWGMRKNGEIFPKDVIFHKGKYFGDDVIITTARDITERKAAEKALRESETKYRILAEKMHDVVWILDLDLKLVYVSPSTEFTLGFTPGERMTMRIDECMVPESLDYAMQVMINEAVSSQEDMADKDRGVLLELEYYHKDGTTRWLEQSINGIYDDKGELSGIMGVARDVTERKKAKDALLQSEESYRGLFNSVTDAIYILDRDGKFIDVNEGAAKMYGYPHEVLVGKDPAFVSAPGKNDMECVGDMVNRAYHGESQQFEFWGKRSNGDHFLKDVQLYSGIYFGQKVIIAMAHDITCRKQNEMALKTRVEEMERLNSLVKCEEHHLTKLKNEVNELLLKLGEKEKYSTS